MKAQAGKYGLKRWVVAGLAIAFLCCAWSLGLTPAGLVPPDSQHWDRTGEFFRAALNPALDYEDENVPADAEPIWWKGIKGVFLTLKFAFGAMSLAVPTALVLGFLGSSAWWPEPCGGKTRLILRSVYFISRLFMSLILSLIHI